MTLVKHRPARFGAGFPVFSNLFGDILGTDVTQFIGSDIAKSVPAVNVAENEKEFRVEVAAPGLKKEDFNVTVDNNILSITSEQKTENTEKTEKYTRREFSYSAFERKFTLPETIHADAISATYTDGVLHIVLPKKVEKAEQVKSITIS